MKIFKADYILRADRDFSILKDGAVVFDEKIIDVAEIDYIQDRYPDIKIKKLPPNSCIIPGLVNPHIHLEFCSNTTSLKYGDFVSWLGSVIQNREKIMQESDISLMKKRLKEMLNAGVTSIGAVSSYGFDLEALKEAEQKVVYFNEVLGSQPSMVDALYDDFKQRYENSKTYKSDKFIPAISIHSPYSTHPIVAKKAISLAKEDGVKIQTHFMESNAEREWCDSGSGGFFEFFSSFLSDVKPVNKADEFLELFEGEDCSFVHCCYANSFERDTINSIGKIVHCPVSNRLLGNKKLDISELKEFALATDGLSSNTSMSMFDEMRSALFVHQEEDIKELSKKLFLASTRYAAELLGFNAGEISKGKDADIVVITLPDQVKSKEDILYQLILHTKKAQRVYIKGERYV